MPGPCARRPDCATDFIPAEDRKTFLLRIDPELSADRERWAADELRSVNGQVEYVLRQAVQGRRKAADGRKAGEWRGSGADARGLEIAWGAAHGFAARNPLTLSMRARLYKFRVPLAIMGALLAGLLAGHWGYNDRRDSLLAELAHNAERSAAAFGADELKPLTGTAADRDTPGYATIKRRLMRFHLVDPRVRFAYIFRHQPGQKRVVFLADSEPENSPQISQPGDVYEEAAHSPGLQEILRTGRPATEGPLKDEFGTWVTGYALVSDDAAAGREVLGLDVAAEDWYRLLFMAGMERTFYVWLLLGLPLAGYVIMRRQIQQQEVIRNLSEAMEQSHSAVMIIDLQSRVEYINAGLCLQMGYSRREVVGRPWRDYQSPRLSPEMAAEMVSTVRAGITWSGEWMNLRKDGKFYPVRCAVTPVKRRTGELACFVAVFDDMTDVKRNETMLREALDRAEAGDRAKSQFLATMSHEVRTPLNGIVGFTNLLLETPLNPEQREYMQTIRMSGEALIQLTSDILDFARIESGKLKLDPQPCDPRECLEDALDLFATRAAEKKLELLHWVTDSVPPAVLVDAGRLRQVLINLINNGVKFTEAGEVEVTLDARRLKAEAGRTEAEWELQFTVRDTGLGIAAEQQGKLFKPFSQLENSTTRRYGGTGLGLAISRNLVQLMGGQITLASEPGVGSTFTFTVRAPEVKNEVEKPPPPSIAGVRLAIAGEASPLRQELVRLATRWGALVTEATADQLPGLAWDIALMDVDLAMAAELSHQTEPRPGLPPDRIIGLVPLVLNATTRAALRPHFRLLVNKPVHHDALRSLLAGPVGTRGASIVPFAKTSVFDLRVLLVEDNPVNQRLMQRVLANLGCRWTLADNGRIGVDELARNDYDIVLMDLHMPEMDGLEAITHIRNGLARDAMRNVWIAALTADARTDQRDRVLAAGANDYLTKPIKQAELSKMLERFLAQRNQS